MSNIYGASGFENQLGEIDAYVLNEIDERGYKPTKDSYAQIVSELKGQLAIEANLDYPEQVAKLFTYVDLMRQSRDLEAKKRAIGLAS